MQTMQTITYLDADNNMVGQCTACHARQGNCEPDARGYKCEACGAYRVYGMEELAIMGGIAVVDVPPIRDDNAYAVTDSKLQPFCNPNKQTFALSKPFWHEGRVWATDGRVAMRYAAKSLKPNASPLGFTVPRMAELPWKEDVQCNHPWPTTKELRGKDRETVLIAGRTIAIRYARKVARLGAVYFCPSGNHDDALAFATSKLEGVLMPLAKQ